MCMNDLMDMAEDEREEAVKQLAAMLRVIPVNQEVAECALPFSK